MTARALCDRCKAAYLAEQLEGCDDCGVSLCPNCREEYRAGAHLLCLCEGCLTIREDAAAEKQQEAAW